MLCNSNKDTAETLLRLLTHVERLFPTCAVSFRTTNGKNKTRECDIEGFVPVTSLFGVVGLPSSFIMSLIGITKKYNLYYT